MATITDPYTLLRNEVMNGEFAPGEPLSEVALAGRYGTSRTPIREALQRLEAERLVERRGRSVTVRDVSPAEILDIYEVRTTLEGSAAAKAALNANDLDLVRLTSARDAMRSSASQNASTRALLNRSFHEALWEASHSPTLVDLLTRINSHLVLASRTTLSSEERWASALAEHDEMIAAIRAHDVEQARRLAEEHMIAARDVRLKYYGAI